MGNMNLTSQKRTVYSGHEGCLRPGKHQARQRSRRSGPGCGGIVPQHREAGMPEEERAAVPTKFKCGLYDVFEIALEDVFSGMLPSKAHA